MLRNINAAESEIGPVSTETVPEDTFDDMIKGVTEAVNAGEFDGETLVNLLGNEHGLDPIGKIGTNADWQAFKMHVLSETDEPIWSVHFGSDKHFGDALTDALALIDNDEAFDHAIMVFGIDGLGSHGKWAQVVQRAKEKGNAYDGWDYLDKLPQQNEQGKDFAVGKLLELGDLKLISAGAAHTIVDSIAQDLTEDDLLKVAEDMHGAAHQNVHHAVVKNLKLKLAAKGQTLDVDNAPDWVKEKSWLSSDHHVQQGVYIAGSPGKPNGWVVGYVKNIYGSADTLIKDKDGKQHLVKGKPFPIMPPKGTVVNTPDSMRN
jgi:hypothetical protein